MDALEDEAENMGLAFLLVNRLEQSSGAGTSGADLIRELGFDELAQGLPE